MAEAMATIWSSGVDHRLGWPRAGAPLHCPLPTVLVSVPVKVQP